MLQFSSIENTNHKYTCLYVYLSRGGIIMNKKFFTKVVVGTLMFTIGTTPLLNSSFAMQNEFNENKEQELQSSNDIDLYNIDPDTINDLTEFPYYNTYDYYYNSAEDGNERSVQYLYFYGKAALSELWKYKSVQNIMKFTAEETASAYIGQVAINGLPKVSTSNVVGYGYYETGYRVKSAQYLLKQYGYNIAVDGSFGPKIQAAVKNFKKLHKLTVDGYVGQKTLRELANGSIMG